MKITILIFMFLAVFSISSQAANPQERVCRLNNAKFIGLDIVNPRTDNIGLCQFSSESIIGSISLIEVIHYKKDTQAIRAFKNTRYSSITLCSQARAQTIKGFDSNGKEYSLCAFQDYSFISLTTLRLGWFSNLNYKLRTIL